MSVLRIFNIIFLAGMNPECNLVLRLQILPVVLNNMVGDYLLAISFGNWHYLLDSLVYYYNRFSAN